MSTIVCRRRLAGEIFPPTILTSMSVRALILCLVVFLTTASFGHAGQFVLFDVTFTFTKEEADNSKPNASHYYLKADRLNAQRPKDWTAPIDYRNGTAHLRIEVLEKPAGGEPAMWSVCYIPYKGQNHGYGCLGTGAYKTVGVHEKDIPMTSFWQNNDILWDQGIKEMHLVIKDGTGTHAHKHSEPQKFFPTKVRMMLIQVSKGSTYDPRLVPGLAQS